MRVCVVSFKPCWREPDGSWWSDGGFPLQMAAIASLFDETTLVVVEVASRAGGLRLPPAATIVGLNSPAGADGRRKLSVAGHLPYYVTSINRHIRAADVVHLPVPGDISLLGLLIGLANRKHLIVRYGSSWAITPQTTPAQRVTRRFMQWFAGRRNVMLATGVGVVSPAPGMQWIFSTALTAGELASIEPAVSGLHRPAALAYVGRLFPEKGVPDLLEALAQLKRTSTTPAPRLALIGDGPSRARLEAQVDGLSLREEVTFHGHLNREQLSGILRNIDLCVQPSLTEGFSKAWLDAMAHGVPVLSSNVGAAAAVIGGDGVRGWLTSPGDPDGLARTLASALAQAEDWPALRGRCRTFVSGRTLEAWAQSIGRICAEQWGGSVESGKLRLET